MTSSLFTHLECSRTGERYDPKQPQHLSKVGAPLLARYDLASGRATFRPETLAPRPFTMWRYAEVLPVLDARHRLSLGEGGTPLHHARRLGERLGLKSLFIKDESRNPTGSFKARGIAVALAKALELGVSEVACPSAGNAGGALAAYAAQAGLKAHVVIPRDAPRINALEARMCGADVRFVDGLIGDAGQVVAEGCETHGWYDVSTLKEPYRIEGKKTMAYELFEQLDGRFPDVILYPTGGGTGLIGMWKAFAEMEALGWAGNHRPRMVSVQSTGCAPILRAMEENQDESRPWHDAATVAPGLRVPKALGDFLILRAVRASNGCAIAVEDRDLLQGAAEMAQCEGIVASPEGGACLKALEQMYRDGQVSRDETVVIFNTAAGNKYLETMETYFD